MLSRKASDAIFLEDQGCFWTPWHWKNPNVIHEDLISQCLCWACLKTAGPPMISLYHTPSMGTAGETQVSEDSLELTASPPELCVTSSVCLAFPERYFKYHGQIIWAFNSCEKERIVKRFTWARPFVSLHIPMEKWDWWSQMLGCTASRVAWQSHGGCVCDEYCFERRHWVQE